MAEVAPALRLLATSCRANGPVLVAACAFVRAHPPRTLLFQNMAEETPYPPLALAPADPDNVKVAIDKLAKAAEEATVSSATAQAQAQRPSAVEQAYRNTIAPPGRTRTVARPSKQGGSAAVGTAEPSASAIAASKATDGMLAASKATDGMCDPAVATATATRHRQPSASPSASALSSAGDVSSALKAAVMVEADAREHLRKMRAKVQRELARATSMAALEDLRERKRQEGVNTRADFERQVGRDVTRKIAEDLAQGKVEPATEEELRRLSEQFNRRLKDLYPDAEVTPNFFTLFKHIDVDGSRRVSFRELTMLIRVELRLSKVIATVATDCH